MSKSFPGAPVAPDETADPRVTLVLRIEWSMLFLRYAAFITLLLLHWFQVKPGFFPPLVVSTFGVLLHNGFAHWALRKGRLHWLFSRVNFFIYLMDVMLIVALTGMESTPLAVLFSLFIVGYCLYAPDFTRIYGVTLLCCAAYALTFLYRWYHVEEVVPITPVVLDLLGIFICGWLMSTLGVLLQRLELIAYGRARALAASEATLRTIFDSTAEPILVCDENEFIVDANAPACDFLGSERESLLGMRIRSLFFDDGTLPNKMASLRTRGEFRGEVMVVSGEGSELDADMLVRSYIRDERRYFVFMIHDITAQKNYQEATRLANLRLAQANQELQQVTGMRSAFIARTSKQLRSPLSALLGFTDLLLGESLGELTPEQRKAVHSCRRTAERVLRLVDQTFEFESGVPDATRAAKAREEHAEVGRESAH